MLFTSLLILNGLHNLFQEVVAFGIVAIIIVAVAYIISGMIFFIEDDSRMFNALVRAKRPQIIAVLVIALLSLVPSKKEFIAIYVISEVVQLEGAKKIPQNTVDLINKLIEGEANNEIH